MSRKGVVSLKVKQRGKNVLKSLTEIQKTRYAEILTPYAQLGVDLLSASTPRDTGLTSKSWFYELEISDEYCVIQWCNSNIQNGINIAVLIQMGHGTGTGGWVEGRDYINPAVQPLFDEIAERCWREVAKR